MHVRKLRVNFLEEEDLKLGLEVGSCTVFASEPLDGLQVHNEVGTLVTCIARLLI